MSESCNFRSQLVSPINPILIAYTVSSRVQSEGDNRGPVPKAVYGFASGELMFPITALGRAINNYEFRLNFSHSGKD